MKSFLKLIYVFSFFCIATFGFASDIDVKEQVLPLDLTSWPNTIINCNNTGSKEANVLIGLSGSNNKSATNQVIIKGNSNYSKKITKLSAYKKIKKVKQGRIIIESLSEDVSCELKGLSYNGDVVIGEEDTKEDISYIIGVPFVYNKLKDAKIQIYNLGKEKTSFNIEIYSNVGKLVSTKKVGTIGVNQSKIFKIDTLASKHQTYHVIPQSTNAKYVALYSAKNSNKKIIAIKASSTFDSAFIDNIKGKLVISNIGSVKGNYDYFILSNGIETYRGQEWVMPYSQRIIDLSKYAKSENDKMKIVVKNYYYPKDCYTDENTGEKECFEVTQEDLLVMNFYSIKQGSPEVLSYTKGIEDIKENSDIASKSIARIPVTCFSYQKFKDKDGDGLCDYEEEAYGTNKNKLDMDNDGLGDGEELFHNNSSPSLVDTDQDGYNDNQEYTDETLAYDEYSFKNSPNRYTLAGLKEWANLVLSKSEQNSVTIYNKSLSNVQKSSSYQMPVSGIKLFCGNLCRRGYENFCKGENVCISGGNENQQEEVKAAAKKCLDQIRDAMTGIMDEASNSEGGMSNEGAKAGSCKFCETTFLEPSKQKGLFQTSSLMGGESATSAKCDGETLTINITSGNGRAYTYPNLGQIFIPMNSSNTTYFSVCHEILHNFGLADLYTGTGSPMYGAPCSMMSSANACMSDFDKLNLQIASAMSQTGRVEAVIIRDGLEECTLENGEKGVHIAIDSYVGKCLRALDSSRKNCQYDYKGSCDSGDSDELVCNLCKENGKYPKFNPANKDEYLCCDKDSEYCNGECCDGECIKDGSLCCQNIVTVGSEKICCDDKSADPRCGDCPDDKPYIRYSSDASQNICCETKAQKFCGGNCCDAPCLNIDGVDTCCEGDDVMECGGTCCEKAKCNTEKNTCCAGELCKNECCDEGQLCNKSTGKCYEECKDGTSYYTNQNGRYVGPLCCNDGRQFCKSSEYNGFPYGTCCEKNKECNEKTHRCEIKCDGKKYYKRNNQNQYELACCEKDKEYCKSSYQGYEMYGSCCKVDQTCGTNGKCVDITPTPAVTGTVIVLPVITTTATVAKTATPSSSCDGKLYYPLQGGFSHCCQSPRELCENGMKYNNLPYGTCCEENKVCDTTSKSCVIPTPTPTPTLSCDDINRGCSSSDCKKGDCCKNACPEGEVLAWNAKNGMPKDSTNQKFICRNLDNVTKIENKLPIRQTIRKCDFYVYCDADDGNYYVKRKTIDEKGDLKKISDIGCCGGNLTETTYGVNSRTGEKTLENYCCPNGEVYEESLDQCCKEGTYNEKTHSCESDS